MTKIKDIIKKEELSYAGDYYAVYLHKRLEKITTAVYLITDFISDSEPLKFHIRSKSINLMSLVMSLTNSSASLSENSFLKVGSLISEIEASLKIAVVSDLISEMNFLVLDAELKKILNSLENKKAEGVGKRFLLSETLFSVDEEKLERQNIFYKGHDKGQAENEVKKVSGVGSLERKSFISPQTSVAKKVSTPTASSSFEKNKFALPKTEIKEDVKNSRRDLIVKVIKDKKEVSVKDIVEVIKDCSEKTLQRELLAMVEENVLVKEGERRWSKYTLKK